MDGRRRRSRRRWVREIAARIPNRFLTVAAGLRGTYTIRHPAGLALVLPVEAIARDDLERLLRVNDPSNQIKPRISKGLVLIFRRFWKWLAIPAALLALLILSINLWVCHTASPHCYPRLDEVPARSPLQDAQCNFSWFFATHSL